MVGMFKMDLHILIEHKASAAQLDPQVFYIMTKRWAATQTGGWPRACAVGFSAASGALRGGSLHGVVHRMIS